MNITDIQTMWKEDAEINEFELVSESLRIPKLHAKYYPIYIEEKLRTHALQDELKTLKLDKFEFYTEGPSSETPSHWELPARGRVLKTEIDRYLDADKDIIKLSTKIQMQIEKLKFLESILSSISYRSNTIRNAIDMIKFQAGS